MKHVGRFAHLLRRELVVAQRRGIRVGRLQLAALLRIGILVIALLAQLVDDEALEVEEQGADVVGRGVAVAMQDFFDEKLVAQVGQRVAQRSRFARAARRQRGDDALVELAQFALRQPLAARPEVMNAFKLFRLHSRSDPGLGATRHWPALMRTGKQAMRWPDKRNLSVR